MRAKITANERPIRLFQAEDRTLAIETEDSLVAATEIEFTIDASTKINKTLSGGSISNVTATGFDVQIDAADTENIKPGPYKFQGRSIISAKLSNIVFTPNKIKIMDSVFVDDYCTVDGDYCC